MTFVAIAVAGGTLISGAVSAGMAGSEAKKAKRRANRAQSRVEDIEKNRQAVVNPYENVQNLSGMASDLSGMASNAYSNLSVATQAAEMQAEEADIALANTLDTLRATGSSAGGATALAQAALQSKKGISASIEKQEIGNEQLRAQGQQALQQIQMSEAQRMQMVNMSEGQRMQAADVQGKAYVFETQEQRTANDLARYSGLQQNAEAQRVASKGQMLGAITGTIGNLATQAPGIISAVGAAKEEKSDRRLKKNIKLIGYSPSGLNVYMFEYIDKLLGDGIWQGVMSDEIPQSAVIKHDDGYDRVDYSQLDVEFKQI